MSSSSDDEVSLPAPKHDIMNAIGGLIEEIGLAELTSAKVRSRLADKFGADFSSFKKEIDVLIRRQIEKKECKRAEEDVAEAEAESRKREVDSDSDSDPGIASTERVPRKKAKKGQGATAASKSRSASVAEEDKTDYADMDLATTIKSRRRAATASCLRPPKEKKKSTSNRRKQVKLLHISDELFNIIQVRYTTRQMVVKKVWEYIRAKDLLDPKNKRFMFIDEVMFPVFKKKRMMAFKMMTDLNIHLTAERDLRDPVLIAELREEKARQEDIINNGVGDETVKEEDVKENEEEEEGDGEAKEEEEKEGEGEESEDDD